MALFRSGYDQAPTELASAATVLARRRILVTGATGFIGGHAVELLHHLGADVHGIARRPEPTTAFATPITWHQADLVDPDATLASVEQAEPDVIVHLASMVKGSRDPDLLAPMFAVNTASTVHVLDAARRVGVSRVLLAGSLEEPDEPGQTAASPYALSKAAAHLYGDYYQATTDVEVVNLQIFMVYGPAQPDEAKLVPYLTRSLLDGRAPSLSSGTRRIDWVYVGDVAEGIARCCAVGEQPGYPVPLGTGTLASVRDVVDHMLDITGAEVEPDFGGVADRAREVEKVADTETTRDMLGWVPTVGLVDGLTATVDWYRANPPIPAGDT